MKEYKTFGNEKWYLYIGLLVSNHNDGPGPTMFSRRDDMRNRAEVQRFMISEGQLIDRYSTISEIMIIENNDLILGGRPNVIDAWKIELTDEAMADTERDPQPHDDDDDLYAIFPPCPSDV